MRPNCVFFPPSQWDPSPPLWTVSEMRLSPEMQTLPLHVHPPPSPPPPPPPAPAVAAAAAAARASSNSRWTRLSMMETARLSSPPPLHFQLRKNSYSRKRAIGQPACPNIAAFLGTNRGRRLSNSRFAAPPRLLSTFHEMLDVAIVTAYFFFLFFFFLQLDLSPSLRRAVS